MWIFAQQRPEMCPVSEALHFGEHDEAKSLHGTIVGPGPRKDTYLLKLLGCMAALRFCRMIRTDTMEWHGRKAEIDKNRRSEGIFRSRERLSAGFFQ